MLQPIFVEQAESVLQQRKGKPTARWGRKATGPPQGAAVSRVTLHNKTRFLGGDRSCKAEFLRGPCSACRDEKGR